MKKTLLTVLVALAALPSMAQRVMDKLDRGLVAQKTSTGVFLSWRIFGEEYYDVKYNVYRDGEKITSQPLNVSNFTDTKGTTSSTYTVSPVVRGVEKEQCPAISVWKNSYMEIVPKHSASLKSTYVPNDACCCDVDGDGEMEILIKYDNQNEIQQSYPNVGPTVNGTVTHEHTLLECLKLDGTVLWWVNCGPNMGDFQNNEINIVGYDWDGDGKAEAVFRAADGTTIHMADGTVYTVGNPSLNYRAATGGGTNWFMHSGKEYLLYVDGQTGKPYQCIDYPLPRLESYENPNGLLSGGAYDDLVNKAWGDGYGHRSSKYFFGAPYLDGKKPSIFLARGIYTQHKMIAFDVNPATHELVERWKWYSTNGGYWMWQGYHNFGIADVDMDGRDEIVFGSMVIDDNGKGLSTTGFGHGDAQHCGDFNPFIHGQEIYACNEDQPGNNYRDATTSKLYHRFSSSNDDGRAMAGNFTDLFPGGQGCSAREGLISLVYNDPVPGLDGAGVNTNFRIYWDGDLLEETFNYQNGKNTAGVVAKYGSWSPIYVCEGSMTNNDTKGTPCYQGDIFGDWREEIIMRTASNNIRIYSTPTPTSYRNYTLWHDHQYRNAMVWQMCGYNQPPHASYFLGTLEGITQAPPPLTMTDRIAVENGGTIGSSLNDKHVIVSENGNSTVAIEEGAKPYIVTFNVPSWVQGTAQGGYTAKEAPINYEYYTCDVTGGAITGNARIVKQGDGILNLPKVNMTHTGETRIWGGTVNFDGTMKNSKVYLDRFTTLNTDGGEFKFIKADYDAKIYPGGHDKIGTVTVDSVLYLNYGSQLMIDIDGNNCDKIKAGGITTIKKTGDAWTKYGPQYIQPVIIVNGKNLEAGDYVIAEADSLVGSVTNIKVEGVEGFKTGLKYENKQLILTLGGTRGAANIFWTGSESDVWNYAAANNFVVSDDETATPDVFVHGDVVEFNDNASNFTVNLTEEVSVDSMKFVNSKAYTLQGAGAVVAGAYVKQGSGSVTMTNKNSYTGGNFLSGGTTVVSLLSNSVSAVGNLGGVTNNSNKFVMENGATLQATAAVTNGSPIRFNGDDGGVINNSADFIQQKAFQGTKLTKKGNGTLKTQTTGAALSRLVISAGTVQNESGVAAKVVEIQSGALNDNVGTNNTINIPSGRTGSHSTVDNATYSNVLTGEGTLVSYCSAIKGSGWYATRTRMAYNMTNFAGTLEPRAKQTSDGRFTLDTSSGCDQWTLKVASGVHVQNSGKTLRIGTVTGEGDLAGYSSFANDGGSGTNTWNVGNDKNFTFAGKVTDNSIFNKMGTGTMTVSGAWTTTGRVTVKEGTMKIGSNTVLGTGILEVAAGATLQSTPSAPKTPLTNSSVIINGTLLPNSSGTVATGAVLFNNQTVRLNSNGVLRLGLRRASTKESEMSGCYIRDIGTLNLEGTISIFFYNYTPQVGDELRLWTNVKTVSGTPKIVCDEGGITFDTSRLSEGILVVSSVASTIDAVPADEVVKAEVYNLSGVKVAEYSASMDALDAALREQNIGAGTYVLRIRTREGLFSVKKNKN